MRALSHHVFEGGGFSVGADVSCTMRVGITIVVGDVSCTVGGGFTIVVGDVSCTVGGGFTIVVGDVSCTVGGGFTIGLGEDVSCKMGVGFILDVVVAEVCGAAGKGLTLAGSSDTSAEKLGGEVQAVETAGGTVLG